VSQDGLSLATRLAGLQAVRGLLCMVAALAGAAGWGPDAAIAWGAVAYAVVTGAAELHRRVRRQRGWAASTGPLYLDVVLIQLASAGWDAASSPFAFMGFTHVVAVVMLVGHRTGLRVAIVHGVVAFASAALRLAGIGTPATAAEVRELAIATFGLLLVAATTAALGRVVEREEEERRREVETLAILGNTLQSLSTPAAIGDAVVRIAVDELGYRRAAVLVDPEAAPTGAGAVLVREEGALPAVVRAALPGAGHVVLVPLGPPAERIGVAAFEWGSPRGAIPGRLVQLTERCCTTTAMALARASLQAEVHRLATTDALTGLANRRVVQDALARHLAAAGQIGRSVALLLIDVDRFKAVNDTHGHAVGDAVLRHVGAVLRASCRGSDLPARYGGEEFVVLLPHSSVHDALAMGERLRCALGDGSGPVPFTVSIGLAASPAHAGDADELVVAADQALYRAKAEGRDRLEVADARRWSAPMPVR
jgi:diguanylate cyclase (GGDEF)-like protein